MSRRGVAPGATPVGKLREVAARRAPTGARGTGGYGRKNRPGTKCKQPFLDFALRHFSTFNEKSVDVVVVEMRRKESGHGEAYTVLRQCDEELRKAPRNVGHLEP